MNEGGRRRVRILLSSVRYCSCCCWMKTIPVSMELTLVTENDVRERVIWPLLVRLGYTSQMVKTQRKLVHRFIFLGHKKPHADRPIRGEADYVCTVGERLNFVIDAKRPGRISDEDRHQTYSYAAHAEIRAVAFAIISGNHFEIYLTHQRPETGPILAFGGENLDANFQRLANTVSPAALVRDFPEHVVDAGVPLGIGLRSYASVKWAKQTYTELPDHQASRLGSTVHYTEGAIVRAEGGGILMALVPSHASPAESAFAAVIDALVLEFYTPSESISSTNGKPTVFLSQKEIWIPRGTPIPVPNLHNTSVPAPDDLQGRATAKLSVFLQHGRLIGSVVAESSDGGGNVCRVGASIEIALA